MTNPFGKRSYAVNSDWNLNVNKMTMFFLYLSFCTEVSSNVIPIWAVAMPLGLHRVCFLDLVELRIFQK